MTATHTHRTEPNGRAPRAGRRSYTATDFFLLRAPALPARGLTDLLAACAGDPATAVPADWEDGYLRGLLELWADPQVRSAIRMAAPDLAQAVDRLDTLAPKDRHRAMMSLGRYLNRMSARPTPLSTVAGVAGGFFGDGPAPVLGSPAISSSRARLDSGWMLHLFKSAADSAEPRPDLELRTNDLTHLGRGRAWLSVADGYGEGTRRTASVRWSPAVRLVLEAARRPRTLAELAGLLTEQYPSVPEDQVLGLLRQLVRLDFLITSRRPALLGDPGRSDAAAQLGTALAPDALAALRRVEQEVAAFNRHGRTSDLPGLFGTVEPLGAEVDADYQGHFLQVDSTLDLPGRPGLPADVQRLAEDAAELFTTVGTVFKYPQRLRDYATALTERYGSQAEVPLLELLSPETGLGAPTGYRNPPRGFDLQPVTPDHGREEREAVLGRMVATALAAGSRELVLDERTLADLRAAGTRPNDRREPTPALDVHLQVLPPSPSHPRWRGVVTETGVAFGGRTFARFHDLLTDELQDRLRGLAAAEEERLPGLAVVELTYLPAKARAGNVSLRPVLRELELPLNVAPGLPADRVLALDDILVGVRDGELYLYSRALERELHVTQNTMLNPLSGPNVCRFLLEVSATQFRGAAPFDWGELASSMPFLPRLVWRDLVVKRARWLLTDRDVPAGCTGRLADFAAAVADWRSRWSVPRFCHLAQSDNTLLLDLESAPSLEELRLAAGKHAEGFALQVEEAMPAPRDGFLRDGRGEDFVAEVVVPVLSAAPPAARPPLPRGPYRVAEEQRLRPPGGEWVYAKLYAESDSLDGLLTGEVAALAAELGDRFGTGHPFFLRYVDPAPHLRLRVHVPDRDRARDVFGHVAAWAHGLMADGRITDLAFPVYRREVERYGGPFLIDRAEVLFQRDSAAALALLGHLSEPLPEGSAPALDRIALTGLSLERVGRILLPDFAERHAMARSMSGPTAGGPEYRAAARDLWRGHTEPGRDARVLGLVESLWQEDGDRYVRELAKRVESGELWSDRTGVVRALLHMHCNRMGLPRDQEEAAYGVWRRLLDRVVGQQRGAAARGDG
ncbi:lantibiotic dehydratase [Kitasatospora sp. NPDC048545]|uniref:lantibiotic dehydratase n=1 Tax=Kitasatospora sp. NPDC048545 TaxID=3157208 RepID=UPI0033F5FD78